MLEVLQSQYYVLIEFHSLPHCNLMYVLTLAAFSNAILYILILAKYFPNVFFSWQNVPLMYTVFLFMYMLDYLYSILRVQNLYLVTGTRYNPIASFRASFLAGGNLCDKSTWKVGCNGRDSRLFRKSCFAG